MTDTLKFRQGDVVRAKINAEGMRITAVIMEATMKELKLVGQVGDELKVFKSNAKMSPLRMMLLMNLTALENEDELPEVLKEYREQALRARDQKPIKKGDVVAYQLEGRTNTGRALKCRKNVTASCGMDGTLTANKIAFTHTEMPVPDQELAKWDVSQFTKQGMGRDFERFTATVTRDGKPVFKIICDGDGGPPRYEPTGKSTGPSIDEWLADLKDFATKKGLATAIIEEFWAEYAWDVKPTGISYADFINH